VVCSTHGKGESTQVRQAEKAWWYSKGERRFGPYSATELREIAASGHIAPSDLLWKDGLPNWLPASSFKGLLPPPPAAVVPPPLPVQPPGAKWWYADNNRIIGPVSQSDLLQRLDANLINLDTLIWQPNWTEWRKLSDSDEIRMEVQAILSEQQRHNSPLPILTSEVQSVTSPRQEHGHGSEAPPSLISASSVAEKRKPQQILRWISGFAVFAVIAVIAYIALSGDGVSGIGAVTSASNNPNAKLALQSADPGRSAGPQAMTNWVRVFENMQFVNYYDPATVRKKGHLRIIRALYDLKAPGAGGDQSAQSLMEYDCAGRRHRILSHSVYSGQMATGRILSSDNTPDIEWQNLSPGNAILQFVCSL
jgi:GYF domain 2